MQPYKAVLHIVYDFIKMDLIAKHTKGNIYYCRLTQLY